MRAQAPEPEWWMEADGDLGAPRGAWNRADFFATLRTVGGAWLTAPLLNPTSPLLGRQVFKKLGVTKITVTPAADGTWTLDGGADLAGMSPVSHGALGGPSRPPMQSIAPHA